MAAVVAGQEPGVVMDGEGASTPIRSREQPLNQNGRRRIGRSRWLSWPAAVGARWKGRAESRCVGRDNLILARLGFSVIFEISVNKNFEIQFLPTATQGFFCLAKKKLRHKLTEPTNYKMIS